MSDAIGLNRGTPHELLAAGGQLALKGDIWDDLSVQNIVQKILDLFGLDIPNWQEIIASFDGLRDAFEGTYVGNDPALNVIQNIVKTLRNGLTGIIDWARIPQLSLSQLTNQPGPNLLSGFGDFADGSTLDGGSDWTWDGSVGGGSARAVGSGTRKVLTSELVAVSEGQQMTAAGKVQWAGAAGTGATMQLIVMPFIGDTAQSEVVISNITSPSASSSGNFVALSGSYTPAAGVTGVRVRITVEAALTAGTVWWDDVTLRKVATSLPQQWVDGLLDKFDEFTDDITAATAWIKDLIEKLTGQARATIEDAIDDVVDFASQLGTILSGGSVGSPLPSLSGALNIGSLQTTLNQFEDIFKGIVVTPINSIVTAVKDWWDQWFGGGSSNAIPLSQKGAANGVAPLNGSSKLATSFLQTNVAGGVPLLDGSRKVSTSLLVTDSALNVPTLDGSGKLKSAQLPSLNYIPTGDRGAASGVAPLNSEAVVPLANLPSEVGGTGGAGAGLPYFSIGFASGAHTLNGKLYYSVVLASSVVGTISPIITDETGINTGWGASQATARSLVLPYDGMWLVSGNMVTGSNAAGWGLYFGRNVDPGSWSRTTDLLVGASTPFVYSGTYYGMPGSSAFRYQQLGASGINSGKLMVAIKMPSTSSFVLSPTISENVTFTYLGAA